MLKIFGCKNLEAQLYAVNLGIGMQLTNILRDIKEDFARGRVYLPQDELQRFGLSETDILGEKKEDNFKALMQFEIERARDYYNNSEAGIKMLADARSRFVVLAIKGMYSGILDDIEKNNYDIYSRRAHVNDLRKIAIVLKILFGAKYL
jgi:phytoene synthase